MPLVTSMSQIKGFAQTAQPSVTPEGSLWYDTANDILKSSDGSAFNQVGKTSFSSAAVVSQSTTIGDYTVPTIAYDLNYTQTSYDHIAATGTEYNQMYSGATIRNGIKILTSAAAIGTVVRKVKFSLKKTGSPTGNATATIRNGSDTILASATLDVTTLTTSYATYEFTLNVPVTMAANYLVLIEYSGGSVGNDVRLAAKTETTETNYQGVDYVASYNTFTTANGAVTFDSTPTPTGQPPSNIYDTNTATRYTSAQSANPTIYVDMNSALNLCAAAFYWDGVNTTETSMLIQTSIDATTWVTKRTITTSGLTTGAWNYYRFNIAAGHRYVRFYGNSGTSFVLSIYEVKVLTKTDAQIFADLGILEISTTSTSLSAAGT